MNASKTIRLAVLGFGVSITLCAAAQTSDQTAQNNTAPAPAFGQNAPVLNPENPPVTGLDEPSLDLRTSSRSFVSPALQVSESADTNGANQLGGSDAQSITRVLGAFDLQKFWPKTDLFLEYLGGGAFYSSPYQAKQLQALGYEGVTRWRTGLITVRDSFSYLPDGSFFIGSYGGAPGLGLASGSMGIGMQGGALPGFISNSQYGSVANVPRLANTAVLDAVQALNPRSAITVAGAFGNAHFYDGVNCAILGNECLINSDQYTAEAGYTHLLNRHDQLGVVYGFQLFQFPQSTGGEIYNHTVNLRYSHSISGRLSLVAGAGPQYTDLELGGATTHVSLSARIQLRYKLGHASLLASYEKFTSSGSGFFGGADTQVARLGYRRKLGRTWEVFGDMNYAHNKKLEDLGVSCGEPAVTCPIGASTASSDDEGSAGAIFRKHLGRSYDFFAAYRFSELAFNNPVDLAGNTGRLAQRHVAMVGLEWHPKPTRIE